MLRLLPAVVLGLLLVSFAGTRAAGAGLNEQLLAETLARAERLPRLHALIVAKDGKPIVERVFRGPSLDTPVNVKSASKTIIDALVGITIRAWPRDPQGVYFGGNEMAVSPRALLQFGEMYRHGGTFEGKRVVPESWIRASWTPLTTDRYGVGYGYGWFIGEALGEPVY